MQQRETRQSVRLQQESEQKERMRLVRTGLGAREIAASPDGARNRSPAVVGRVTRIWAATKAVGPTEGEQPGQGPRRREQCPPE